MVLPIGSICRELDGAFMDIAPTRAWAVLQWDSDGVVSFFVVCFGVLVW
jgi:hypothetical protein